MAISGSHTKTQARNMVEAGSSPQPTALTALILGCGLGPHGDGPRQHGSLSGVKGGWPIPGRRHLGGDLPGCLAGRRVVVVPPPIGAGHLLPLGAGHAF